NLPTHACGGWEIVLPLDRHPRQSIAATDMASSTPAERAAAIVQGDLRDGAEKILTRHFELHHLRDQDWCDACTQDIRDATFSRGDLSLIGMPDRNPSGAIAAITQLSAGKRARRSWESSPSCPRRWGKTAPQQA